MPAPRLAALIAAAAVVAGVGRLSPRPRWIAASALTAAAVAGRILAPGLIDAGFWPQLGALFMFRAFVFWRDARDESWLDALSYLLAAPALYFLIFPIVDYRSFLRRSTRSYAGVEMIARGALQLVALRLILRYLYVSPADIVSALDLLRFSFCALCSLLEVTAGYHIAVGMLALLGRELPRPADRWLLSTSLLDYWGRSNRYWKVFMLRTVYFPAALAWRSPVIAGAAVFAATWLMHGWQRFWLSGGLGFTGPDAAFWAAMGVGACVSLASDAAPRAAWLRVPATLLLLCALWGMASMPTLADWAAAVRRAL